MIMICDYYIHFGIFLRPSNVYKYEIDSCEMTLFVKLFPCVPAFSHP